MLPVTIHAGRGLRVWEPFREFGRLNEEVDRLFSSLWLRTERGTDEGSVWLPAIDLYEDNGQVVVKAELPGVRKEDLSISLTDDALTIKGERRHEKEEKDEHYYRLEGSYGSFQRVLTLPKPVKAEAVNAEFKDGVLKITFPKAEEAKTRQIKIEAK